MPLTDKVAAAKQINEFLGKTIAAGGFRWNYRITVDPPVGEDRQWERPEILVEFGGADSGLLLERGAETLRALEHLALEMLRLQHDEHEKISFDCRNYRAARMQELQLAADVAAERVRKTNMPYPFAPMSSRERRILHLALGRHADLRTESQGEAMARCVVVYPKDYQPPKNPRPMGRRR